jgi:hypothetical protein
MASTFHDQDIFARLLQQLPGWPHNNQWRYMYDQQGRLVHLSLAGLHLDSLPPEVWQFSHLHTLHLADNHLKQLPAEIGQLSALFILTVTNNDLEELPVELGQLTQLRILKLRGNSLQQFPDAICQLPRLRELDIAYNQLKRLPAEIGQSSHLQKLYVAGNHLRDLPVEPGQLSQLQVLDLRNNHLEQRPIIFDQLPHLQELWMDDEQEDWFAQFTDDNLEEEIDPYLPYIAVFYKLFFSDNDNNVRIANQKGMFPVTGSGMGCTGVGSPDIVDLQRHLIWETRGGEEELDPGDVLEGMHQTQLHLHALLDLYKGEWKVGDIAHFESQIQRSDLPTLALTPLGEGPWICNFANGGQITLGVAAPGVLGYTWRAGTPRLKCNGTPVLISIRPASV